MILTSENYFSKDAEKEYLSVSQYKKIAGCLGRLGCEAKAMAEIRGEWEEKHRIISRFLCGFPF